MKTIEDLMSAFDDLPDDKREAVEADAMAATAGFDKFVPNIGPQTEAYFSPVDVLLYGGEAGGGKSSLLCGLALQAHRQSLLMRRQYADLGGLTDEAIRLNGSRKGYNGSIPPRLTLANGGIIDFGACALPGDEQKWKGRPRDLLGFDEAADFLEDQVRFLMGWVRSTVEGQRCRTVMATNPPTGATGQWLVPMFRPWLDVTHPDPAKQGELRWFITDEKGKDIEVDGPEPVERDGETYIPMSRTFIGASLSDNPYLVRTDYRKQLDALPEPFRSAYRDGNFMAAKKDAERQVIPTAWVHAAQARWTPDPPPDVPQTAMAMDVSEIEDAEVLAQRHDHWYGELIVQDGGELSDGASKCALIVQHRRNNAALVIDVGGGYASGLIERLNDNSIPFVRFDGSRQSFARTQDGSLGFQNKRAEAWWKFREALDPDAEHAPDIALPPDPALTAELTAATFTTGKRGILVESKKEIRKRLGRSTDRADAVIMAWSEAQDAIIRGLVKSGKPQWGVRLGNEHVKRKRRKR